MILWILDVNYHLDKSIFLCYYTLNKRDDGELDILFRCRELPSGARQ